MKCGYCNNELRPGNKLGFCDIDCRRNKQLSTPGFRTGTPTKAQEPSFNKKNYQAHSKQLKKSHSEFGHIVNMPT